MKTIPRIALALLLAAPAVMAQDAPSPAPDLLQAFLADVESLSADFRQVVEEAGTGRSQASSGRLYLQRPGRFRWDYESPVPQLVVADGESLWLYDPDLEQVTVRTLDESLRSTPAMLLTGEGRLEDAFETGASYSEDGVDWVELKPRGDNGDFAGLRVGFENGVLAGMELIDSLGQTTRIAFEDVELDPTLDPTLFEFEPPEGADVIRESGF